MAKSNAGYQVVVENVREVQRELGRLKRSVRNKIIRDAMKKAHKPALTAAKSNAPKDSGLLRKSLGSKVKTYRTKDITVAIVGPRSGFKRRVKVGKKRRSKNARTQLRNPTHYSHFAEKGNRRGMKGTRFLQRAYQSTLQKMGDELRDMVWEGLRQEAAKSRAT